MFGRRKKALPEIDAREELVEVAGARGPSALPDARKAMPPGARVFMAIVIILGVAFAGWFIWRAFERVETADDRNSRPLRLEDGVSELRRPPPAPPLPPPPVEPPTTWSMPQLPPIEVPAALDTVKQRRLSSGLRSQDQQDNAGSNTAPSSTPQGSDSGPLADQLQSLQLASTSAAMLGNRDMLLTQGMRIDCILLTRIVSTQPGLMTCMAPADVWSASGRVVLVEAGTVFTGYKVGELEQGQNAIFATWSRMQTPAGVIVELNSPGTGPLGEGGISGAIDTRFGERIGNAMLLSLVGDLGDWVVARGGRSSGDGTSIRLDNTREGTTDAVSKILDRTLDIPPILYKNHGERIGITVARDVDFTPVYELKPKYR